MLGNLAQLTPEARPAVVNHYNVQPVIDVYASTQGRDLGGVASDIMKALKPFRGSLCRAEPASSCAGRWRRCGLRFSAWELGLLGAIVLVYLLIVVNFQSWLDPFIIITALPGALAGICWFLLITRTTLSVPSLTGAVMCMGVATANSILMVSFARDRMDAGVPALQAAIEAGYTRMRPVLMTALAMIIGMLPMALGLGEGGEQNAPLGRAVIGGLLFATVATLFFVPSVFAIIHGRRQARHRRPGEGKIRVCGESNYVRTNSRRRLGIKARMQRYSTSRARRRLSVLPTFRRRPTRRAKMRGRHRAARVADLAGAGDLPDPQERNGCAGEGNGSGLDSDGCGRAAI